MIAIERGCDENDNCMDNGDHVVIPSQSEVPNAANSNVFIYNVILLLSASWLVKYTIKCKGIVCVWGDNPTMCRMLWCFI